ncbi:T9SS type A sorting domain-containing protein [Neolewinella sp.]|uniref:T9SS type A sorting domain-containing protein n=1 Tax=Neolewinella sp. TaxID=2993543 RepID=UPI003B52EA3C
MKQRITLTLAALLLSVVVFAQETIIVEDGDLQGGQDYTWSADNVYILNGLIFLEEGGTLTIEPGTVIQGRNEDAVTTGDNTSALIITRGAQIFASGEADNPIIFTAEGDDMDDPSDLTSTDRGEWGGLIILGNATIARPDGEDGIEGIDADEERARFGGDDDEDNSGVIRYVSIRHGGAQLSTDNEINGLTLGGVGSGTTIEYVEIFANLDDGIEWFGGTVSVKYASVAFCGDDGMDYDFGWRGNGQFWFVLQGPGDGTGRSGEHDGANPDGQSPFSQPTIYNATYVGIGEEGTATGGDANRALPLSVLFRDNAGGFYYNSIFTGFNGAAIAVEDRTDSDEDSYARFQAGDLDFVDNMFEDFAGVAESDQIFLAVDQDEVILPASTTIFAAAVLEDNEVGTTGIAGLSRMPDGGLDPRINADGEALSGGEPNGDDDFFSVVSYRGAFGNRVNWLQGWTALSDYGYLGDLVDEVEIGECVTITDDDLQGGQDYTWEADSCYTLDGLVFLEADGTLTIEAGTKIYGLNGDLTTTGDNTSALIITRDAQIFAEGTADSPIIFTASGDDTEDADDFDENDRGEWGGLIILGNATIARPDGEDGIEGIDADEERARFGGDDDEDNSGTLRYVSIRHGGAQLSTDNEINGLTLGGVGSGTTMDYIEVFANLDDGIEWFGGTVRIDHAAVSYCGDDGMDYDFGWRGGGQYWFVLQGPGNSTGRSGEHDGASPDNQEPFSNPTIYNATYIGIGENGMATGGDANRSLPLSVIFRDNAGGHYNNSIFTDFNGAAIGIEDRTDTDVDSYTNFLNGDLSVCNSIFFGFGAGEKPEDIFLAVDQDENVVEASTTEVAAGFMECGNRIIDPALNSISDRDANGFIDPRPFAFDSTATQGAPEAGEDFESVAYYGAFAPGSTSDNDRTWLSGWTELSTSGLIVDFTNSIGTQQVAGYLLDAPSPNPSSQLVTVGFELPRGGKVTLTVMDFVGRPLAVSTRQYSVGQQQETIKVANLPNGTYLIVLDTEGGRLLQKMVVAH